MDPLNSHGPFTSAAHSYDAVFSRLGQTERLRSQVQAAMLREWSPGNRILDLGCGTGDDVLFLAQRGFWVTGMDPAVGMLEETRTKLNRASVRAELLCLGAGDLGVFPGGSFDGILSNFAAVNTVADFPAMLSHIARILQPGGSAILCLLSRWCFWETAGFLRRGSPRQAFRRLHRNPVMVRVGDGVVPTYYRSLRTTRRLAKFWFDVEEAFGLSVLTPPPSWEGFAARHPRLSASLSRLEPAARRLPVARAVGDHFVIVLRKKGAREFAPVKRTA
jgi:ubiquinone/menaquinone biosynthesis C-methylase UbiE